MNLTIFEFPEGKIGHEGGKFIVGGENHRFQTTEIEVFRLFILKVSIIWIIICFSSQRCNDYLKFSNYFAIIITFVNYFFDYNYDYNYVENFCYDYNYNYFSITL